MVIANKLFFSLHISYKNILWGKKLFPDKSTQRLYFCFVVLKFYPNSTKRFLRAKYINGMVARKSIPFKIQFCCCKTTFQHKPKTVKVHKSTQETVTRARCFKCALRCVIVTRTVWGSSQDAR